MSEAVNLPEIIGRSPITEWPGAHDDSDRVIAFTDQGSTLRLTEMCDQWFHVDITQAEARKLGHWLLAWAYNVPWSLYKGIPVNPREHSGEYVTLDPEGPLPYWATINGTMCLVRPAEPTRPEESEYEYYVDIDGPTTDAWIAAHPPQPGA